MYVNKWLTRKRRWLLGFVSSFFVLVVSFQNCSAVRSANADKTQVLQSQADILGKQALEILSAKCLTCHNPDKPEAGISDITDLNYLLYYRLIIPGQPEISDIIRVIKDGKMPPSGGVSNADIQALNSWILDGLVDSSGNVTIPAGSSSLEPTYSSIKVRIINTRCLFCHSGANPQAGIDMTTYNGLVGNNVVQAGNPDGSRMIRAVERPGNDFMPRQGSRLTATEIGIMRQWIQNGGAQ